jgi:hypothetical protein
MPFDIKNLVIINYNKDKLNISSGDSLDYANQKYLPKDESQRANIYRGK